MIARVRIVVFAAFAAIACSSISETAQAQDPYGFQFAYTLGYQYGFRNRLPTPPYFSIYPPVYYGARYQRPYGDSPYAAFPQLQPAPDYHPVPKQAPYRSRSVTNPHVQHHSVSPIPSSSIGEPIAQVNTPGKTVKIINPYAQPQFADTSK